MHVRVLKNLHVNLLSHEVTSIVDTKTYLLNRIKEQRPVYRKFLIPNKTFGCLRTRVTIPSCEMVQLLIVTLDID